MSEKVAISVRSVSKTFKLPHEKHNSIKSLFVSMFRGKKSYERQQVLKDISFEIKEGEFFGIVGRNGSGKSTLLKLLSGIYEPDSGAIQVSGRLTPFIELGVGFNPELTGRENVYLNGALLGFTRKEMDLLYDEIVGFAELEKFMDQKLKNYSSGMQVRLAFSIAIRTETDILLLDEVLAVGDIAFQQKCYEYFARLKKDKKTIVFVTHDMSAVERFCSKVLIVDKGGLTGSVMSVREAVKTYNTLNQETSTQVNEHQEERTKKPKKNFSVESVELLSSGKKEKVYEQGKELEVVVSIKDNRENNSTEELTLGLAFHDVDNVLLSGPNSIGVKFSSDNKKIKYKIPKLPLNGGKYYLTVALYDQYVSKLYDLKDKDIVFSVATDDVRYGKVVFEDSWSVD